MTSLMDKPDGSKKEKSKEKGKGEGGDWTPKPPIKGSYSKEPGKVKINHQKGNK